MEYITLSNGIKMPLLGLGVYQIRDGKTCYESVLEALKDGYRLIDTAQAYGNEEAVGQAIADSGIARKEIFLTTKIWISAFGYEKAKASIGESLRKLGTDYLDLLLIHQPFGDYYGAYKAMEEAYKAKKLRAIGVSNFYPDRLVDIASFAEIPPMVNQIETHPYFQRWEDQRWMNKYHVVHESWASFAEGKNNIFNDPVLVKIGLAHQKTAAQVILRWLIQRQIVVIPKSVHAERIKQNIEVFDFTLTEEEMQMIKNLDAGRSCFLNHEDPSTVEMFASWSK
jgi:2,5-diketo-D-gluconate reductase A